MKDLRTSSSALFAIIAFIVTRVAARYGLELPADVLDGIVYLVFAYGLHQARDKVVVPKPPRKNRMISRTKIISLIAAVAIAAFAIACSPDQVRGFARGLSGGARTIDKGIPTVRSLRVAGEIAPETALDLARDARDANSVMGEVTEFLLARDTLDETGRQQLHRQMSDVLSRARNLRERGTIRLKDGRQQLIFDLVLIGGETALETIVEDLGAPLPDGITIPIDDETRRSLEQTRRRIERNEEKLREAIERLQQPSPAATPQAAPPSTINLALLEHN